MRSQTGYQKVFSIYDMHYLVVRIVYWTKVEGVSACDNGDIQQQESGGTAKMTAQCVLYPGALKIFESLSMPTATFAEIFNGLLFG